MNEHADGTGASLHAGNSLGSEQSKPEIPISAAPVIKRYTELLQHDAPHLVDGLYVHGSIALGAFRAGQSDVDFIAVLTHAASDDDVSLLDRIHRRVASEQPHCAMEGSYLQWSGLGLPAGQLSPCPCYHDGLMRRAARHDINPVTWWMLKHHALTILGPEPLSFSYDVTWYEVRAYMAANLHTYWASFTTSTRRPTRLLWLLTDQGTQWAVLGVSRLLYGLREGGMVCKEGAGQYALTQVPVAWHPLIREALALRTGNGPRVYKSALPRARDTMAYVRHVIDHAVA